MNNEGDPSPRPRRIVHDAQEHAFRWHEVCLRVHQGVSDVEPDVAARMYHTAVLNLWKQLERFRDQSTAKDLWNEPVFSHPVDRDPRLSELLELADLLEADPDEVTLSGIADRVNSGTDAVPISLANIGRYYHLRADDIEPTVDEPEGGRVARVMEVPDAFAVHRQLDDVAHEIGFDADLPDPVAAPEEAEV